MTSSSEGAHAVLTRVCIPGTLSSVEFFCCMVDCDNVLAHPVEPWRWSVQKLRMKCLPPFTAWGFTAFTIFLILSTHLCMVAIAAVFEVKGSKKRPNFKRRGSSGDWVQDCLTWQEQTNTK